MCFCSIEAESFSHNFLRCHFFDDFWATPMNNLRSIDSDLPTLRDEDLTYIYIRLSDV